MVEFGEQQTFKIDVPTVNKRRVEQVKRKEVLPKKRILAKNSVVYLFPIVDQVSLGKTQEKGWVWIRGKSGDLVKVETDQQIPIYTSDKIPTVLEAGAIVYTNRERLIKPK